MSRDINDLMIQALERAKRLVTGDRQKDYGTPEESFGRIAALWTDYLGVSITAEQVAIMMALLKIGRSAGGRKTPDTYHDLIGYAAIAYALRHQPEKLDMMPVWKHVSKESSCVAHRKLSAGLRQTRCTPPVTVTLASVHEEGEATRTSEDISLSEAMGLFVEAMSIQADIDGMKANDKLDEVIHCGSYPEMAYFEKAEQLRKIAARLKGNGNG